MTADAKTPDGLSLKRWSRRKLEAAREKAAPVVPSASTRPAAVSMQPADSASAPDAAPAPVAAPATAGAAPSMPAPVDGLPPVESLTIDSDFAPFFQPRVGDSLKRQALKQLFRDPHFNVMDGLDVYVGDYSLPDPISADVVKQMVQGRYIFDPPATRINAQGHVEDVPPQEAVVDGAADPVDAATAMPSLPATAAAAAEPEPAAPTETHVDPAAPPDAGTPEPPAR